MAKGVACGGKLLFAFCAAGRVAEWDGHSGPVSQVTFLLNFCCIGGRRPKAALPADTAGAEPEREPAVQLSGFPGRQLRSRAAHRPGQLRTEQRAGAHPLPQPLPLLPLPLPLAPAVLQRAPLPLPLPLPPPLPAMLPATPPARRCRRAAARCCFACVPRTLSLIPL